MMNCNLIDKTYTIMQTAYIYFILFLLSFEVMPGTKQNLQFITMEVKKNNLPWRYIVNIQKKEVNQLKIWLFWTWNNITNWHNFDFNQKRYFFLKDSTKRQGVAGYFVLFTNVNASKQKQHHYCSRNWTIEKAKNEKEKPICQEKFKRCVRNWGDLFSTFYDKKKEKRTKRK